MPEGLGAPGLGYLKFNDRMREPGPEGPATYMADV